MNHETGGHGSNVLHVCSPDAHGGDAQPELTRRMIIYYGSIPRNLREPNPFVHAVCARARVYLYCKSD